MDKRDSGLKRVAMVRALHGLGDLLCAVPAWRALRAGLPASHLALVGQPGAADVLGRFRLFDEYLDFPGFPGIPESPRPPATAEFLLRHRGRFDLAIQMHGSGRAINAFVGKLGARRSAGFYPPGSPCPEQHGFLPYPSEEPEVRRHLALVRHLGVPLQGESIRFPVTAADRLALRDLPEARRLTPRSYVCLHPGARDRLRRWPAERFAAAADAFATAGLTIVITGTAAEAPITAAVQAAMRAPAVDLTSRTSLGALAALLADAALVVTNDTGVSHLAAALSVPSVVVFQASDPRRWAPLDQRRHRALGAPAWYPDHPSGARRPRRVEPSVAVPEVVAAGGELLGREAMRAAG